MTFAFLRSTTAFTVALIGAALLGGAAPASGASITYSDPSCASFTITGSNGNFTLACSGASGGGGVPLGAPTGCSIAPVSPLPVGGGPVSLTASCTGGDPATGYHWTASPTTTGFPNDAGAQTSANITTGTTFTVVAYNANGNALAASTTVQVGGVAGAISCAAQGFSKTLSYTWNWAAAGGGGLLINTYNDPQGPIGPNGIIVVAFTPMVSVAGSKGNVSIAGYPPPNNQPTTRTSSISTTPCTFNAAFPATRTGSDVSNSFTVGNYNTRLYAGLVAGTTYYINIATRDSSGTSTCSANGPTCDMRVQLNKPVQ